MSALNFALGARTHFSLGESLLAPKDVVKEAKKRGYTAAALADTMTVSSMIDFSNACKKEGIKPIVGVRLRIVDDPTERKPKRGSGVKRKDNRPWFPKLFAKSPKGVERIMRLLSLANSADRFYEVARLGFDDLLAELDGNDLVLLTGDFYSVFHLSEHRDKLQAIASRLAPSNTLVELLPIDTPLFDTINKHAIGACVDLRLEPIITFPALYESAEHATTLDVLNAISRNVEISEPWHNVLPYRGYEIPDQASAIERVNKSRLNLKKRGLEENKPIWLKALQNTGSFAARFDYVWSKMPVSLPKLAVDEYATLKAECVKGWKERFAKPIFGHQPDDATLKAEYVPRLQYELGVLKKMGFEGYFLLVQDLVRWSKSQGILVGPGRGSVGGSLIAYLMGITDVDPIRFNLLFERFINPDRLDLPDADLDFMSARRHEVIKYLVEKYGADKVAGISNYGTLASASALRDVARVYGEDLKEMTFTKLVPKEHGKSVSLEEAAKAIPDIDKYRLAKPDIWKHATKLEGAMRSYGRHAAGIVVGGVPLIERAVVESRQGEPTVNWDKRVVEDMGLVKMDILGLSTLDVLDHCIKHIWKRHTKHIDLLSLPIDDERVLNAFGKGDTIGIFQFESGGMKKLLKDLAFGGPLTFEDLSAATALYRPGPMDSGLLDEYVAIKQGVGEPSYEHPNMKPALEATYGVMVYQEQVMQLARDLAGMTFTESDHLRKAMGKKDKDKMAEQRGKWVDGCQSHSGMSEKSAQELFDKIELFAGYAFNRSHSVEYSLISYIAMWLKVYYPIEFYAASMTIMDEDKIPGILADAKSRGIVVMPPDINESSGIFEILNDKTLLIPFNRLKGISDNTTGAILFARSEGGKFKDKADFITRVEKRRCNIRHQEILDRIGAFARIEPGQLPSTHESRLKDQIELLPGLTVQAVKVSRDMVTSPFAKVRLNALVEEWRSCKNCLLAGGCHPKPFLGKEPKFMVVTDGPSWTEEENDRIAMGSSFSYVHEAMLVAELAKKDAYFTTLIKSPKPEGEKFFPNEVLKACPSYLDREIEILKPPLIVALGSNAARHFVPELKGGVAEHNGMLHYSRELDATIIIGISPGMIAFDGGKQRLLNDVFMKAKELLE